MNDKIVNNLAIDIANLHVQLARANAENAQLKAQLDDTQKEN